jgi:hypothetical protein
MKQRIIYEENFERKKKVELKTNRLYDKKSKYE